MISSDVIRGCNDTIILFLLMDQPSYGYQISKLIRELSENISSKRRHCIQPLPGWKNTDTWNLLQEAENLEANREPITRSPMMEGDIMKKNARNGK